MRILLEDLMMRYMRAGIRRDMSISTERESKDYLYRGRRTLCKLAKASSENDRREDWWDTYRLRASLSMPG
jgi:hypothetical protein